MSNQIVNNILNQIGPDSTADTLEKGRGAAIGEIRDWGGKKYQKTQTGWVPVKSSGEKQKPEPEQETKMPVKQQEQKPEPSKGGSLKDSLVKFISEAKETQSVEFASGDNKIKITVRPNHYDSIKVFKDGKLEMTYGDALEDLDIPSIVNDFAPDESGKGGFEEFYDKESGETVYSWVESSTDNKKPSKEPPTRNAEKVKAIQDWIGDDASEQEISDVLDAIAEFVPDNALRISGSSSPRQEQVKIQKRIDAIMDTYREHFDHYDGTDSMSDDKLYSILWGVLMDKKNS